MKQNKITKTKKQKTQKTQKKQKNIKKKHFVVNETQILIKNFKLRLFFSHFLSFSLFFSYFLFFFLFLVLSFSFSFFLFFFLFFFSPKAKLSLGVLFCVSRWGKCALLHCWWNASFWLLLDTVEASCFSLIQWHLCCDVPTFSSIHWCVPYCLMLHGSVRCRCRTQLNKWTVVETKFEYLWFLGVEKHRSRA